MTWIPNEDKLMVQQLNRKQNHSKYYIVDAISGISSLLMEEKDDAWIDIEALGHIKIKQGGNLLRMEKNFYIQLKKMGGHIFIDIILKLRKSI